MGQDGGDRFGGPKDPIRVNELDGLWKYLQTVDWTEPWFLVLGTFHITCAILTVVTRKTGVLQSIYFACLLVLVLCAEYINEWAANNWRLFAQQQYFDSNGLFISIVFSVPLLVNCLFIVISWLWDLGFLISDIRVLKIRQGRKLRDQETPADSECTNGKEKEEKKEK